MIYNKKIRLIGCTPFFFCFLALCLVQGILPQYGVAEFEQPGVLKAQDLLNSEILKGKYYAVDEEVQNDGMFNHYRIRSPFGVFRASSTSSLQILVQEIEAIGAIKTVKTDDTALGSLKQSGENTATGVKNLVTDPLGTFENAAAGVSGLFNRAKQTVGKREVTGAEDSKFDQFIGLSKSKGQIASRFGVNMYSRNQVLQEELNRLAKADYLGGLSVGIATSFVPGVGGIVLSTSGTARLLNEAINNTPASELWVQNKNKLLSMGMNADTIQLFLNNPAFSPALQTVMVTALETMKGVANLELYIKIALQAGDPNMARVITETTVLTAGYHKNIAPLKQLAPMARLARAEKKDGTIVVVLPTDHIIWTERVADVAGSLVEKVNTSKGTKVELWVSGDFSTMARNELEGMGWKVHTKVNKQLLPAQHVAKSTEKKK